MLVRLGLENKYWAQEIETRINDVKNLYSLDEKQIYNLILKFVYLRTQSHIITNRLKKSKLVDYFRVGRFDLYSFETYAKTVLVLLLHCIDDNVSLKTKMKYMIKNIDKRGKQYVTNRVDLDKDSSCAFDNWYHNDYWLTKFKHIKANENEINNGGILLPPELIFKILHILPHEGNFIDESVENYWTSQNHAWYKKTGYNQFKIKGGSKRDYINAQLMYNQRKNIINYISNYMGGIFPLRLKMKKFILDYYDNTTNNIPILYMSDFLEKLKKIIKTKLKNENDSRIY